MFYNKIRFFDILNEFGFIYFEKATKRWRNLQSFFEFSNVKKISEISSCFVAFSEYMNFMYIDCSYDWSSRLCQGLLTRAILNDRLLYTKNKIFWHLKWIWVLGVVFCRKEFGILASCIRSSWYVASKEMVFCYQN